MERHKEEQMLEDRRVARICATIINSQGGKKNKKAATEDDFMPKPKGKGRKKQTVEEQLAILSGVGNTRTE